MSEVNIEAVTAAVAAELTKDFLAKTVQTFKGASRTIFEKLFPNFEKHLTSTYIRNSHVKIISNRDVPIKFESIYVNSFFNNETVTMSDVEVSDFVKKNNRTVISAIGGAGKTFLMRFLWMKLFREKSGRVPIFIELRRANAVSIVDLENFIRASAFGTDAFTPANFASFCEDGTFIFILDGFDEVTREKRPELEKQIINLAEKYPKCGIVVSGRPDDRFDGWQGFHTLRALPFEFSQFLQLINKVPFDTQIKNNFVKIADRNFFNQHASFLSNPLLSIMMLLTYRDNAEIPKKISAFYENCFATLFSQHDALKESFRREKCLDQSEFKRIFSVFCLFTYRDSRFSFDGAEFLQYVNKAKDFLRFTQSTDAISHDFLESVNLVIKEGTNYSFIHRSFQEFFAAYCVTNVLTDSVSDVLAMFALRQNDRTFKLAFELHPALVFKSYLIPTYLKFKEKARLPTRREAAKKFKACELAGIEFVLQFSVFDEGRDSRKIRSRMLIRSLMVNLEHDLEEFLFACDNIFANDGLFLKFQNLIFHIANSFLMFLHGVKKSDRELLNLADCKLVSQFTSEYVNIRLVREDGAEVPIPDHLIERQRSRMLKNGIELERVLTLLNKKLTVEIENAIDMSQTNRGTFVNAQSAGQRT